ncbi:Methylated-DNA--protein-cysteine methyltransferase, constitutive [Carnimonas sp. R-84981]|uniref:methylated-DNA--[protein]-cysteine S-methyltransferase n=1 Tax=Carnimonas bestiolae TaxID=3402172 RepID=UPI003EDC378B
MSEPQGRKAMHYGYLDSSIGKLLLAASERGLAMIQFATARKPREVGAEWHADDAFQHPVLAQAKDELQRYFSGEHVTFSVPLAAEGTEFQHRVWQALSDIPYGETRSYGQLAAHIHSPKSVRAVGAANGRNPLPIIVPCHRVIGSDGSLTGFAGGIDVKRRLLALEACQQSLALD